MSGAVSHWPVCFAQLALSTATRCNEAVTIDSRKQMSHIRQTYSHCQSAAFRWRVVAKSRPSLQSGGSPGLPQICTSMSNHGIWRCSHLFASEEAGIWSLIEIIGNSKNSNTTVQRFLFTPPNQLCWTAFDAVPGRQTRLPRLSDCP